MTAALASSDLCVNSSEVTVGDCFWSNDFSQGITVSPKQQLFLNPFITFPQPNGTIPFSFSPKNQPETSRGDVIYTLIESDLLPLMNQPEPALEVCS